MAHPSYFLVAFIPLLYVRIRRSIGYRKFGGNRLFIPMGIFLFILVLVFKATAHHPASLAADAVGTTLGAVLGYLAIRQTEFEVRNGALYFRTHIWIQVSVLALFLLRMGYRIYGVVLANHRGETQAGSLTQSFQDPVTAGAICLLFVFNLAYFGFVLREGNRRQALAAAGSV